MRYRKAGEAAPATRLMSGATKQISCFPVSVQVILLEEITCLITADDADVLSQRGFFNNESGVFFFPSPPRNAGTNHDLISCRSQ